jgi:predicted phosphodiesterase
VRLPIALAPALFILLVGGLGRGLAAQAAAGASPFIVKPYLQLGDSPFLGETETYALLWHTDTARADWHVDVRTPNGTWLEQPTFYRRLVNVPGTESVKGLEPFAIYEGTLGSLKPGADFEYRLKRDGVVVFQATARGRKGRAQPQRFLVTGDAGINSADQKAIAYRMSLQRPDLVAIAGDIVYGLGRMSEYRTNFFPIYNADQADSGRGAPLMRSVPFVGALGNHDAGYYDRIDRSPDNFGYFAFWSMPLNGPYRAARASNTPTMKGDSALIRPLTAAMRGRYPQMANYSFDFGNAHWTVIDGNVYMDWTDAALRNWLARDIAAATARGVTWKFVMFHQPGFNSSKAHYTEQQMRLVADIFEQQGVDIVFAGHVHNYQRSYPLKFLVKLEGDPKLAKDGVLHPPNEYNYSTNPYTLDGDFTFDKVFDGVTHTRPDAPIYIVDGAGGAGLYTPEQTGKRDSWQAFTVKMIADKFSFSVVDLDGTKLTLRQIAANGAEIDRFVITKPERLPVTLAGSPRPQR